MFVCTGPRRACNTSKEWERKRGSARERAQESERTSEKMCEREIDQRGRAEDREIDHGNEGLFARKREQVRWGTRERGEERKIVREQGRGRGKI